MFKQIVVLAVVLAMVVCVFAQYDQHYQTEEKKFISLPALKLKLNMDKLTFKLPNLGSILQTHQTHHYQPSY